MPSARRWVHREGGRGSLSYVPYSGDCPYRPPGWSATPDVAPMGPILIGHVQGIRATAGWADHYWWSSSRRAQMPKRLSTELEREVRRLKAKGHGLRVIGRMVERSRHAVSNVLSREPQPARVTDWNPFPARLSAQDREEMSAGLERAESYSAISRPIGFAMSTVSREAANGRAGCGRCEGRPGRLPGLADAPLQCPRHPGGPHRAGDRAHAAQRVRQPRPASTSRPAVGPVAQQLVGHDRPSPTSAASASTASSNGPPAPTATRSPPLGSQRGVPHSGLQPVHRRRDRPHMTQSRMSYPVGVML